MNCVRGFGPLRYCRLGRAEWDDLASVELDPGQVQRFLGSLADILAAVRSGPAHSLVAVQAEERPVAFYVVHPDARDGACWWLGWIAVDRRLQGRGLGRLAMLAALRRLSCVPSCRRVRLLVAPDNLPALHLYEQAGFRRVGWLASTAELIFELAFGTVGDVERLISAILYTVAAHARRVFRNWRLRLTVGPHAAWVIGVERGPPCSPAATSMPCGAGCAALQLARLTQGTRRFATNAGGMATAIGYFPLLQSDVGVARRLAA